MPQVMGFVINVGEVVNARMMTRPLMTVLLSIQAGLLLSFGLKNASWHALAADEKQTSS